MLLPIWIQSVSSQKRASIRQLKRQRPNKHPQIPERDKSKSESKGLKESEPFNREVKGTLILRRNGRFFKVIKTRHTGGNWWTFECKDIESKQNRVFKYEMLGIYEALDSVASILPMNRKRGNMGETLG